MFLLALKHTLESHPHCRSAFPQPADLYWHASVAFHGLHDRAFSVSRPGHYLQRLHGARLTCACDAVQAVQRARQLNAAAVRGNWDEDALLARQLQQDGQPVPVSAPHSLQMSWFIICTLPCFQHASLISPVPSWSQPAMSFKESVCQN